MDKFEDLYDLLKNSNFELVGINDANNETFYMVRPKKEKIKVEFIDVAESWEDHKLASFDFLFNKEVDELDKNGLLQKAGEYLSKELEIYLNEHYGK